MSSEGFGKLFTLGEEEQAMLQADDSGLMLFAFRFLKQVMFGEQSIGLNEEEAQVRLGKWRERQIEIEKEAAEKRAKLEEDMLNEGINEEDSGLAYCADESGNCGRVDQPGAADDEAVLAGGSPLDHGHAVELQRHRRIEIAPDRCLEARLYCRGKGFQRCHHVQDKDVPAPAG